jgi:hypothetical protein
MVRSAHTRFLIHTVCAVLSVTTAACSNKTSAASVTPAGGGGRGRGGRGGGDAPVVTANATEKDVAVEIAAIGNVEAYATISIRSQVTGLLQEIAFHEGDFVKKRQTLFTLDRRPFEAALAQAEANLVRDEALLAQAESQLTRDAANAEYLQLSRERQTQPLEPCEPVTLVPGSSRSCPSVTTVSPDFNPFATTIDSPDRWPIVIGRCSTAESGLTTRIRTARLGPSAPPGLARGSGGSGSSRTFPSCSFGGRLPPVC